MRKGDKSKRAGIEDFLCPFTDMYITQGANGSFSHQGTMANDVRGLEVGIKYPYYAPCTCKCLKVYPSSGQSLWQSVDKVRFANGRIDYASFMIAHDDSQDCYVGQVVEQGEQLGNMGTKGYATGVHCHIEITQSNNTSWNKNSYGIYCFNNESDTDECYFVDNTNILEGMGGNWKVTSDIKVDEKPSLYPLYKCLYNMYVRWGASTNDGKKLVKDLTLDGQKNATSTDPNAFALYKEGTIFTVYEYKDKGYGLWGRSPSGWICLIDSDGTIYCERVED